MNSPSPFPWIVTARNALWSAGYRAAVKPFFFRQDPEEVHEAVGTLGELLGRTSFTRSLTRAAFDYRDPILSQTIRGLFFPNPVGLSAGFDKNAHLARIAPAVGFGFAEFGSVTGRPCGGNARPRLWRLPAEQSLVVHYGLMNDGAVTVAERLEQAGAHPIPFGVSIAKTNDALTDSVEAGIADYCTALTAVAGVADYITVNISCPNTSGGEPFRDLGALDELLAALRPLRRAGQPLFVKLAFDYTDTELDQVVALADRRGVDGFVCCNLCKSHPALAAAARGRPIRGNPSQPPTGGCSGRLMTARVDEMIRHLYRTTGGRFTLVGSGGMFTADDAYRRLRAGASLLQLLTGLVYGGPQTVSTITAGLAAWLRRDGFGSISDVVGADCR